MSYTSFVFFIAYFGITYLLYTVVPKKAKWCVLLVGSWAFYLVAITPYRSKTFFNLIKYLLRFLQ